MKPSTTWELLAATVEAAERLRGEPFEGAEDFERWLDEASGEAEQEAA